MTDIFHNVSLWEKVFLGPSASRDDTVWPRQKLASRPDTLPGGLNLTMKQAVFFAEEGPIKPKVLHNPFYWFYHRLKTTPPSTLSESITSCYSLAGVQPQLDLHILVQHDRHHLQIKDLSENLYKLDLEQLSGLNYEISIGTVSQSDCYHVTNDNTKTVSSDDISRVTQKKTLLGHDGANCSNS